MNQVITQLQQLYNLPPPHKFVKCNDPKIFILCCKYASIWHSSHFLKNIFYVNKCLCISNLLESQQNQKFTIWSVSNEISIKIIIHTQCFGARMILNFALEIVDWLKHQPASFIVRRPVPKAAAMWQEIVTRFHQICVEQKMNLDKIR